MPTITRNRIRSSVLEAFEAENPRVGDALSRLASSAADDYDYLHASAQRELDSLVRPTDARTRCRRSKDGRLSGSAPARRATLHLCAAPGSTIDLTATHVETALECVMRGTLAIESTGRTDCRSWWVW